MTDVVENELTLNTASYPSPFPQGLTGFFTVSYPATGQDVKAIFTNAWGATTIVDLGAPSASVLTFNLIPTTTAAAFGVAAILWLAVSGALRTRKPNLHQ